MDNFRVAQFHDCCHKVLANASGGNAEYGKTYARAGLGLREADECRVQALYISCNLAHWRGDLAKQVKAQLKAMGGKAYWEAK